MNQKRMLWMIVATTFLASISYFSLNSSVEQQETASAGYVDKKLKRLVEMQASTAISSPHDNSHPVSEATIHLPLSYESALDLHQFFMIAKESKDPSLLYQGYRAYIECQSLVSNASNLRAAFSGGDPSGLQGPLTPERQAASEELLKRCRGFERMSERDLNEAGIALREKAKKMGSVEAIMDGIDPPAAIDSATLIGLLQAHTPSAYERAAPALATAVANSMNVLPESSQFKKIEIAVMLAGCDLGKDCSASSYRTLLQCTYYNNCQKPLYDDWQSGMSDTDIQQIIGLKTGIVHGVVSNAFHWHL
ncbi:hypothetical protein AAKU55_005457 [Oxalobacteraceae bacterium GrIS 1.11]